MAIITLLEALFKSKPPAQAILIWTKRNKRSAYFTDILKAEKYAIAESEKGDVYFGVCTISGTFSNQKDSFKMRATVNEVVGCPALYLDIDYGDSHQKKNLPLTEQDAMALIAMMPTEPSFIINSGNGLHAYWMFDSIILITNNEIRNELQDLSRDWNHLLINKAKDFGYGVDSVFDLARVLRVPQTLNWKSEPPKPVTIIDKTDKRYTIELLREYLDGKKINSPAKRYRSGAELSGSNSFILTDKPVLDTTKLEELMREIPLVRQSYERTGRMAKEWTASSWDLSLATYAAQALWTDQEIVDLLVSSRIKHSNDLKLRVDYYERTLAKARAKVDNELMTEDIQIAVEAPIVDNDRVKNLANLSEALGIEIVKFVKFSGDKPTYVIYLKGGQEISFTSLEPLDNQRTFRRLIAEKIDNKPNGFKNAEWDKVVNKFLASVETLEGGRESSSLRSFESMLAYYLQETYNDNENEEQMFQRITKNRPGRHNDKVVFSLLEFAIFVGHRYGEKRSRQDYAHILRRLGSEGIKISFRVKENKKSVPTSRLVWTVPLTVLSLYQELGSYEYNPDEILDESRIGTHLD